MTEDLRQQAEQTQKWLVSLENPEQPGVELHHVLDAQELIRGLVAEVGALQREIAEAREACPIVRRQDYFDAPLLTCINEEISQLFMWQSRAEAADAKVKALMDKWRGERFGYMSGETFQEPVGSMNKASAAVCQRFIADLATITQPGAAQE